MKRLIIAAAMAAATITSAHAEYTEHQKAVLMNTAITGGIYKRFCPGYEALPQHTKWLFDTSLEVTANGGASEEVFKAAFKKRLDGVTDIGIPAWCADIAVGLKNLTMVNPNETPHPRRSLGGRGNNHHPRQAYHGQPPARLRGVRWRRRSGMSVTRTSWAS